MIRCYHRARVRALVVLRMIPLLCLFAASAARADELTTIAVIPLVAEQRLAIYGAPVASELATALRDAGRDVVLVSDVAVVPARAWLVVDGRLVATGKAVSIELRIRDPEHAVDVARLAAQAPRLEAIDTATAAIATQLVAAIAEAEAARLRAQTPRPPPVTPDPPPDGPAPVVRPPPPPPIDPRPTARVIVRGRALHDRAGAALDVPALVRPAMARLANRLGYRVVDDGAAALEVTVELTWVAAGFEGAVPIGRGRARVQVSRDAQLVFDRKVRTDTVIGSRGDRVDTVVRLIAAQAADVVLPRLREQLGAAR